MCLLTGDRHTYVLCVCYLTTASHSWLGRALQQKRQPQAQLTTASMQFCEQKYPSLRVEHPQSSYQYERKPKSKAHGVHPGTASANIKHYTYLFSWLSLRHSAARDARAQPLQSRDIHIVVRLAHPPVLSVFHSLKPYSKAHQHERQLRSHSSAKIARITDRARSATKSIPCPCGPGSRSSSCPSFCGRCPSG